MSRNKKNLALESGSFEGEIMKKNTNTQFVSTMKPETPSVKINIMEPNGIKVDRDVKDTKTQKAGDSRIIHKDDSHLKPERAFSNSSNSKKDNEVVITSKIRLVCK